MNKKYYHSINFIRIFTAVTLACVYHYIVVFGNVPFGSEHLTSLLAEFSYIGVEMFFLISGFVIYGAYGQKIKKNQLGFFHYLGGRIKRIYPMMIASVFLITLMQWLNYYLYHHYAIMDYYDGRNTWKAVILSILGLNSGWICDHDLYSINGVTWYISILMICYVFFFVIMKLTKQKKTAEMVLVLLMMLLGMWLLKHPMQFPLLFGSNARGYFDFFLGVWIAIWYQQPKLMKRRRLLVGVSVVLLVSYVVLYRRVGFNNYFASLLLNQGLFLLVTNIEALEKLSDNQKISYLGKISFPIYLWNLPVFSAVCFFVNVTGVRLNYCSYVVWIAVVICNIGAAILMEEIEERNV